MSSTPPTITPVSALERIVHCLDRAHLGGFKTKAFVRALDVVRSTPVDALQRLAEADQLTTLEGIGGSTAEVITQALAGTTPDYLTNLEATTQVPMTPDGQRYRDALRGDLHMHSRWSDG
ncbi:MAG TPA: PHP domain-containing protein, partial [Ilumatobacteraceae bacterium]|nr:PHP domain-containing protein [Ilumatobacteraceae bacterium]